MSEQAGGEVTPIQQTEIEPSVAEITAPTTGSLQRLRAEVQALDEAYHWAKAMSRTTMVPEQYQFNNKPKGCTDVRGETATYDLAAAVLYGSEIGLSAMQSAQNVFVVHGKPAVYAMTMAGQVRAAGYVIEPVEESDEKCVWKALRDGTWASSEWTMERATQAGYTSNDRYKTNPMQMLRAKAISEVCRIKFPDVLLGMAYTVEELQLENAVVQRVTKPGGRGTSKLRELAEEAQAEREETPPGAINAQVTEIRKLYKANGITGQDMLDDLTQFLQRPEPVKTLHDLAHDEAADVITKRFAEVENPPPEPPIEGTV
jgi:hypothetical protein